MYYKGLIHRYRDYLPVEHNTPIVSLQEGNTPLLPLDRLKQAIGFKGELYAKYEGLNPTGSFKDRGMTVAISMAKQKGKQAVICASTGNTSASAAAYAASAGMQCFVLIPSGKIAKGKLAQAIAYGATIVQIDGNFDAGMQLVKEVARELPLEIVNSINPYRPEGQKTAAFEIVDQLGDAPDYHIIPVGNAANIAAYWQGYNEYFKQKHASRLPKMVGCQAQGAAPFLHNKPITAPETIATAIRIGNPQSWDRAKAAQVDSNGWFIGVTDDEILAAQHLLASKEGIFAEPASCASIAGLAKCIQQNQIGQEVQIVCTLTGHGLKDAEIAIEKHNQDLKTVRPTLQDVHKLIEQVLHS